MNIARRTIESVGWNALVSIVQVIVGVVRSVVLARLLPVELFGVYGLASSIIAVSRIFANFGVDGAFLHRTPETADEDVAAGVLLSLKLLFGSAWAACVGLAAYAFFEGDVRTALTILIVVQWGVILCAVPRAMLIRRVEHRRLAIVQFVNIVLSTAASIFLAWKGAGLWALLSTDVATLVASVFFLYLWRPIWRPRLAWTRDTVSYYLRFGSRNMVGHLLLSALDRFDDLWTGAFLGQESLGFYSRAYAFATYPRSILASSVNKVSVGTYAELAGRRKRLSQAFFRTNAFLVRSGFFLAGLLALVAPEFIELLLGAKWLPMLRAFRLMLVFTLFDPINVTIANLFVAVGRPEQIVRARAVQLVVMLPALFMLGPQLGIAGIALAVDIMMLVGIAMLLWQARKHVDFSLRALLAVPGAALIAAILVARTVSNSLGDSISPWWTGSTKAGAFALVYGVVLVAAERRQMLAMSSFLIEQFSRRADQGRPNDV